MLRMISESAAAPPRSKPKRQQAVLTVQDKTQVSKNLVRLCLGGSDYVKLNRNSCTDAYVKLLLPRPGSGLAAPFDMDRLRIEAPELLPARRTYTVRRWDDANERLWIDVVLHNAPGQHGLASDWATRAHEGDQIALMGAGGGYSPHPEADLHVLVGDHATVPAIAAALEVMPSSARGHAVIHVEDEADILSLSHPEGFSLEWVVGAREGLLVAVETLDIPHDIIDKRGVHVFCHAERGLTKQLRAHLVRERGIAREDISISAYWALGRVEDRFQAEKREAIGRIDPD